MFRYLVLVKYAKQKSKQRTCDHFAETVLKVTIDVRTNGYTDRTLPNFTKAAFLTTMGRRWENNQEKY